MKKIKTTKIGKKEYVEVDERIRLFWELHPTWSIITEMIYNCEENLVCIFKATIIDDNKEWRATGTAREFQADKKSMVNKTSHVENCETSAIGRALGVKGIITEYGIASADEVRNAIEQEKSMDKEDTQDKVIKIVTDAAKEKVEDEKPEVNVASDYASATLTQDATPEQLESILGKKPKQKEIDELEEELSTDNAEEEQEYLVDLNKRVSMLKNSKDAKALAEEGRKWSKNWTYKKDEYQTLYKCIAESFATYKRSEDQAKAAESKGGS